MAFDVAKALNENGDLFNSIGSDHEDIEDDMDFVNEFDTDSVDCKKEVKTRISKPLGILPLPFSLLGILPLLSLFFRNFIPPFLFIRNFNLTIDKIIIGAPKIYFFNFHFCSTFSHCTFKFAIAKVIDLKL